MRAGEVLGRSHGRHRQVKVCSSACAAARGGVDGAVGEHLIQVAPGGNSSGTRRGASPLVGWNRAWQRHAGPASGCRRPCADATVTPELLEGRQVLEWAWGCGQAPSQRRTRHRASKGSPTRRGARSRRIRIDVGEYSAGCAASGRAGLERRRASTCRRRSSRRRTGRLVVFLIAACKLVAAPSPARQRSPVPRSTIRFRAQADQRSIKARSCTASTSPAEVSAQRPRPGPG